MKNFLLEGPGGLPGLKQVPSGSAALSNIAYTWGGTHTFNGSVVFNGSITGNFDVNIVVPLGLVGSNANALSVAKAGTNYAFNIDTSTTSAVTGLNVKSKAAASGLALSVLSTGTNENLAIDAKGSGTVTINGTATGIVVLPAGTTIGGSVPLISPVTSTAANTVTVGPNGATNPSFNIDNSVVNAATGFNIQAQAAGGGLILSALSSGSNESIFVRPKGSGGFRVQTASTVALQVAPVAGGGPNFVVNNNAGTAATGVQIVAQAAAGGVAVSTISTGTDESMTFSAKGAGTLTLQNGVVATAGGAAASGIMMGSLSIGFFTGTGAPTFSAMNGSVYVDSNATTTTTRIYVNKSGAGTAGTTWTNLTTAA